MPWSANFELVEKRLQQIPDKLLPCIQQKVAEALAVGKTSMETTVNTSGTDYSLSQGRSGRVDTGEMLSEINSQTSRSGNTVNGFLGWLEGTPMWARYQELGFTHYLTGKDVEGMHAIANASEEVWDLVRAGCEECLAEAVRG